jgi:ATP-binding cassette subfamily B (MDR/TAP) protein 1
MAFLNSACTPAFAYLLARLLNCYYLPVAQQGAAARMWACIVFGIAVLDGTSSYLYHYLLEKCGRVWVDILRIRALDRILSMPRAWFDNADHAPGKLNETLDRNAEEMRNLLGRFAGYAFVALSMILIAVTWALIMSWKLTLVGLAAAPVMYVMTRLFETYSGKWEGRTDEAGSKSGAVFEETFGSIRIVRAFTLERWFEGKHRKCVQDAYAVGKRRSLVTGVLFGLNDSTTLFAIALVLWYGSLLVGTGQWPFSRIVATFTLLLFSMGSVNDILAFIPQITSSRATATMVLYLSSLPPNSEGGTGARVLEDPLPIRLQNLSFSYPTRRSVMVLRNISLTIAPGSYTAIVGSSGSGKSTIASLLLGLYPPHTGPANPAPLCFAGVPSSQIEIKALRQHMALVPQFPIVFPASVAENIAYSLPAESPLCGRANIEAAARAAGIYEFVTSLSSGFSTRLGEGGQGLSGGQTMRLAIARALVRRPKVLILDEPTAALDRESGDIIAATLRGIVERNGRDVAVVLITHDLRMMKGVGRIVVLEKGKVEETGSWDELVTRGGALNRLISGSEG